MQQTKSKNSMEPELCMMWGTKVDLPFYSLHHCLASITQQRLDENIIKHINILKNWLKKTCIKSYNEVNSCSCKTILNVFVHIIETSLNSFLRDCFEKNCMLRTNFSNYIHWQKELEKTTKHLYMYNSGFQPRGCNPRGGHFPMFAMLQKRNSPLPFFIFHSALLFTDPKNLQQDHCSSICNALMMITKVIERSAICHW